MNELLNYDDESIDQNIQYFNEILKQQKHLSQVIENNSKAQIQKTTNIINSMNPIIEQHYNTLHDIDNKLRTIIINNKKNLQNDIKYQEFLKSDLSTKFQNKINEVDTLVFNLKKLLKKEGIELLPKKN